MMPRHRALVMLLALGACHEAGPQLPYYTGADFTPHWELPADGAVHAVRPFQLVDQDGLAFTERELEGRIAVVSFFFTACSSVCPKTIQSMLGLQSEFRDDDDVLLLTHSVTPQLDTAAALGVFALANQINSRRWKLLTGAAQEIYDLGRYYYFLDDDQGEVDSTVAFTHTENFVLVDQQRRLRGIYNGMDPTSMEALARDIRLLKPGL